MELVLCPVPYYEDALKIQSKCILSWTMLLLALPNTIADSIVCVCVCVCVYVCEQAHILGVMLHCIQVWWSVPLHLPLSIWPGIIFLAVERWSVTWRSVFNVVLRPCTLLIFYINLFTRFIYDWSEMAIKHTVASHCHDFSRSSERTENS